MNNLSKAINNSNLILIEGGKRSGKLTFTLFLINEYLNKKTLFFSSYEKKILQKRINIIKTFYIDLKLENFILLSTKKNFIELKRKFGFNFLLEDIKKAYQNHLVDVIVFHKFDLLFQIQDIEDVEIFINQLISFCEENNIKVIFISELEKESAYFIDFLENYIDIHFITKKEKNFIKIKIKYSIFPLEIEEFKFIKNDKLKIIPYENIKQTQNYTDHKILLISQDKYLISLNEYILANFNLNIASSIPTALNYITHNPDLIIYNPFENSENYKEICNLSKQNINIIYISNKEFIRNKDKMEIIKEGCFEVFRKNFNFEEYIITLQKLLNNFFYDKKMKNLKKFEIKNLNDFTNAMKYLLEKKIFFTLIKGEICPSKLRNYDFILKLDNICYFILINITKFQAKELLDKMNIKYEKIISANEIDNIEGLFL